MTIMKAAGASSGKCSRHNRHFRNAGYGEAETGSVMTRSGRVVTEAGTGVNYGAVFGVTPTSTVTQPALPLGPLAWIR